MLWRAKAGDGDVEIKLWFDKQGRGGLVLQELLPGGGTVKLASSPDGGLTHVFPDPGAEAFYNFRAVARAASAEDGSRLLLVQLRQAGAILPAYDALARPLPGGVQPLPAPCQQNKREQRFFDLEFHQ